MQSFSSKNNLPTITTQSVDNLMHENGNICINMEPSSSVTTLQGNIRSQTSSPTQQQKSGWTTMTPQQISTWIDKRSRFLFPCAFGVFNIFYWSFVYYL